MSANDHDHERNSDHYLDAAIDFQGTGLDDLAQWYRGFGYRVLWQVRGHFNHVHVARIT